MQRDLVVGHHRVRIVDSGLPTADQSFVLIHGIGVSGKYFTPLREQLDDNCRVICIDLPGFGASSRPKAALSIADFAQIVGSVISQLKIINPVLVGHSMGCQIVMELAFQNPSLAQQLVIIGPTVDPGKRSMMRQSMLLLRNAMREPGYVNRMVLREYMRCGVRQYIKTLRPMLEHHIEERLKTCRSNVTIIRGAKDIVASHDWVTDATSMLARGTMEEIPDAAHGVHITNPQQVAAICLGLVKN